MDALHARCVAYEETVRQLRSEIGGEQVKCEGIDEEQAEETICMGWGGQYLHRCTY